MLQFCVEHWKEREMAPRGVVFGFGAGQDSCSWVVSDFLEDTYDFNDVDWVSRNQPSYSWIAHQILKQAAKLSQCDKNKSG